jgi:hypothetical protein
MAEVKLARFVFLNKGFPCPVEGCGETVTRDSIREAVQNIGEQAPSKYVVRCPKCWTTHMVVIEATSSI